MAKVRSGNQPNSSVFYAHASPLPHHYDHGKEEEEEAATRRGRSPVHTQAHDLVAEQQADPSLKVLFEQVRPESEVLGPVSR
ncbi:unnamed protein product [Merluccius merluccius]